MNYSPVARLLHSYTACGLIGHTPPQTPVAYDREEVTVTLTETEEGRAAPGDGTGAGMIAWLGWTIQKNMMVDATASALRTASQKVLAVEDGWATVEVSSLDLDSIVNRFRIKHRGDMKDQTLNTYEQRFRQTVDMYGKWLADEPWQPATRKRTARPAAGSSNGSAAAPTSKSPAVQQQPEVALPPQPGMITYPFPIRPGMQGKITLPEDLSTREAKRIAAFIGTLAFDDEPEPQKALTTGPYNPEE